MSLVDRCDEIGQRNAIQVPAAFLDPCRRLFRQCPVSSHWDKAGDRLAMTSDGQALTSSHPIKQARKVGLGFVSANCLHTFCPNYDQSIRLVEVMERLQDVVKVWNLYRSFANLRRQPSIRFTGHGSRQTRMSSPCTVPKLLMFSTVVCWRGAWAFRWEWSLCGSTQSAEVRVSASIAARRRGRTSAKIEISCQGFARNRPSLARERLTASRRLSMRIWMFPASRRWPSSGISREMTVAMVPVAFSQNPYSSQLLDKPRGT